MNRELVLAFYFFRFPERRMNHDLVLVFIPSGTDSYLCTRALLTLPQTSEPTRLRKRHPFTSPARRLTSDRPAWLKTTASSARGTQKVGGRQRMGFTGSSSATELAAQEDLEQEDADFEIEVNYEIELAAAAAAVAAVEPDPDVEFLEALQSNDTTDIFDWFFREQARLAFLARGN